MRKVLVALCNMAIEERRNTLETVSAEDLKTTQGEIKGIKNIMGIIETQQP
jgi:hypothetical protein